MTSPKPPGPSTPRPCWACFRPGPGCSPEAPYAFLATAVGTIRHHEVDTPDPNTVEGVLYELPHHPALLDAGRVAAALAATPAVHRESPWYGYSPLDPAHLAGADGVVFVKNVRRSPPRP